MAATLAHISVAPKAAHKSTVIFLHGLGDSGHGWLPVFQRFGTLLPHTKFILPHASERPITRHRGAVLPAWFDMRDYANVSNSQIDDEPGLRATSAQVDKLIQAEVDAGVPENEIVLGGYSQGGAVASWYGVTSGRGLGGVVVLSSWLPLSHKVREEAKATAKDVPVFWGHGEADPIVAYQNAVKSVEILKELGLPSVPPGEAFARPGVRFESYPGMEHTTCAKEIEDLAGWLKEALP
ncbi:acyl-protein thioesterase-1 [Dioszegia hungarica]|uniref:Acyl-protein thioesterase 1 n=1 Tax=Dioszegia hungarica TaxID=4972 RepID=A0AA38LWZ3_9TREE|nr:acyl-protein thioesterase-1 [Dioszegia hungarica]KAI9636796.1 acyl-protein thioesterase-1 [Dioszegia hungarica]